MTQDFARKLIEPPDDETIAHLFAGRIAGIFWVDWREADDYMVELAAACLPAGNAMLPEWIDSKLHIRFRDQRTPVPLEFKPGEQDVTLLALNRALAPDFEIRYIKASDGGDTLAFMLMGRADWAELEAAFASKVDDAFGRLEAGSALFAHDSAPAPVVMAPAPPTRVTEALARVKEGRELAAQKKFSEAVALFDDVIQRFGDEQDSDEQDRERIRIRVLMALVAKGIALFDMNRLTDAIAAFDEADRRYGSDIDAGISDLVGTALFNRILSLKTLKRFAEEVTAVEEFDRRYGKETTGNVSELVSTALVNRAFSLGQLNRLAEQTLAYEQFVQRYEADPSPTITARVALALNGGAYSRMMRAKQNWADRETRTALLARALPDLRRALTICEEQRRVMILGNLGYALFLSGDEMGSARETQACLQLGGKAALAGQLADAAEHRLAKEDAEYEDMLQRLWKKLNPAGV